MGWVVIVGGAGWAIWSMTSQLLYRARLIRRAETEAQIKAALEADRANR